MMINCISWITFAYKRLLFGEMLCLFILYVGRKLPPKCYYKKKKTVTGVTKHLLTSLVLCFQITQNRTILSSFTCWIFLAICSLQGKYFNRLVNKGINSQMIADILLNWSLIECCWKLMDWQHWKLNHLSTEQEFWAIVMNPSLPDLNQWA